MGLSSTRQPKRTGRDDYQTPHGAILSLGNFLLEHKALALPGLRLFEPCRGHGAITDAFHLCFDEIQWCEITEGTDYLKTDARIFHPDWIITNPPFSLAMEFLQKSLTEAENVAYLLRLNFLGSRKRREFWQAHPPTALVVLAERPCFTGNGATDSCEYAWFIWSKRVPRGIYVA